LRCWREQDKAKPGHTVWRFSVREVGNEPNEYALRSLGQLVDFLMKALFTKLDEE